MSQPIAPDFSPLIASSAGVLMALACLLAWVLVPSPPERSSWGRLQALQAGLAFLLALVMPVWKSSLLVWGLFVCGQIAWLWLPHADKMQGIRLAVFAGPILLMLPTLILPQPAWNIVLTAICSLPAFWQTALQRRTTSTADPHRQTHVARWELPAHATLVIALSSIHLYPWALSLWFIAWSCLALARLLDHKHETRQRLDQLELQLQESKVRDEELDDLRHKDQLQSLYFQNSSHELRTPLHGLLGFLRLISQGQYGPFPPDIQRLHTRCLHLAETLQHQVDSLLDLSQSHRGMLQIQCSRFPLEGLARSIEQLADGLQARHPETSFELRRHWSGTDSVFIQDFNKIVSIARNLLSNAFSFAKPGRPNHVVCVLTLRNRLLTLEVSDQGLGIARERLPQLFKYLAQKPEDRTYASSSGSLGLTTVGHLLLVIDSEIMVHSEEGLGSKFTVLIPEQPEAELLAFEHAVPPTVEGSMRLPLSNPTRDRHWLKTGDGAHILVVDDNEINCELIREMLLPLGYRVSIASSGHSGLSLMQKERPDLVLLDLMMPDVSGADVIREKQLNPQLADIPVILVTARATDEDRIYGLELGADDYLAKPIIQQELVLRVRNLLGRMRLTRQLALAEEREKLAQLGELLTDCSTEIQQIYRDALETSQVRDQAQKTMVALEGLPRDWHEFFTAWLEHNELASPDDLGSFPLPKESEQAALCRELRLHLVPASWPMDRKRALWQEVSTWPKARLALLVSLLQLIDSYRFLQRQSTRARDILESLLRIHFQPQDRNRCSLDRILRHAVEVLKPRMKRIGARIETQAAAAWVAISPAVLMQISLNLLAFAFDQLEELLDQDKWIRLEVIQRSEHIIFRLRHGGPRLSPEEMSQLFEDQVATDRRRRSLAISRRLAQGVYGRLAFKSEELETVLELELPVAEAEPLGRSE